MTAESQEILGKANAASGRINDPVKKQQLEAALTSLNGADEHFAKITDILAPTAQDTQCKNTIEKAGMLFFFFFFFFLIHYYL